MQCITRHGSVNIRMLRPIITFIQREYHLLFDARNPDIPETPAGGKASVETLQGLQLKAD